MIDDHKKQEKKKEKEPFKKNFLIRDTVIYISSNGNTIFQSKSQQIGHY